MTEDVSSAKFSVTLRLSSQEARDLLDYCHEKRVDPLDLLHRLLAEEIAK